MTQPRAEDFLNHYADALAALEGEQSQPSSEQIVDVLSARDSLYRACKDNPPVFLSGAGLVRLSALDNRLKKKATLIANAVNLADYRGIMNPLPEAWWWFFRTKETISQRFSWVYGAFALLLFTISLSLLSDLISRFLSGGPDIGGILLVIVQTALTFIFTGGIITKIGRDGFDRILKSLSVPEKNWPWIQFGTAVLVFGLLIGFRLSLPLIAVHYNNLGVRHSSAGQYASAQYDFNRALKLNPEYIEAHYNLGSLFEDLGDSSSAQTEYKIAIKGGLAAAYNNLSRLYNLEKKYDLAIPLLLNGIAKAQDAEIRYDLYKNFGWARLGQNRLADAEAQLRTAISIKANAAPAHCLLAQVLDGLSRADEATVEWKACLAYADARIPDEDAWINMAQTNLGGNKP